MKKQHIYILPITALVGAYILWGINPPLVKMSLESVPVAIAMSIRFLAAALILFPFAIRTWKPLKRKDFWLLVLSSVLFNSFGSLALNIGLQKTTSISVASISLLAPLLLFALSALFLKERIALKTFLGILVALAGSIIIIGRIGNTASDEATLVGNLFVLFSVFCVVIATLLFKPLVSKTSTYQAAFASLFFGVLPVAIYACTQVSTWNISATTSNSIIGLIGSIVVIVAANTLFFYALQRKQVQTVAIYYYIRLAVTIIAAWVLLSEQPSLHFWIGTILICLGIYLVEVRKSFLRKEILTDN